MAVRLAPVGSRGGVSGDMLGRAAPGHAANPATVVRIEMARPELGPRDTRVTWSLSAPTHPTTVYYITPNLEHYTTKTLTSTYEHNSWKRITKPAHPLQTNISDSTFTSKLNKDSLHITCTNPRLQPHRNSTMKAAPEISTPTPPGAWCSYSPAVARGSCT